MATHQVLHPFIGASTSAEALRTLIARVASSTATALITGESGTGKELVARSIFQNSRRAKEPFMAINCAAIPETLLESELFGYERGAFTGAHRTKRGYVEEADGGTIFLDEIGDMSRPLQAKLLRFLEDGSFTRVGGTQELRVQVRLIAATNRNIVDAIKKGEFREDLFHRLNVMQFRPPPLRERGTDIALLARNFLRVFALKLSRTVKDISPLAMHALQAHSWPGNVRELENAIYRSAVIAQTDAILVKDLPADICGPGLPEPITTAPGAGAIEAPFDAARAALPESVTVASARASAVSLAAGANPPMLTLEVAFDFLYASLSKEGELMQFRIERELARRALVASGGDASMAAKHLGLTKATLAKRLSE